ncbi:membrane protein [Devosia sp. 17-2-E-8]|uniref:Trimeric intracellular cation channel family protein n=3 Tax=Paradevosia shaoguanensis TaxID=1335043 RepID=A0AA41QPF1_9HYPH|nr:trimeric intracellular cation channel family protein [Paradevosia shaoguanensis]KFL27000.1 membrane protein [Devosia sp. 17-2-E-8]MCF1743700.1 trimeric intracellular cation channel family protein [Paradevosia shaoguanensis]MCI0128183.1 trimeric intracellular cation channel family protein [Paradevosia shaoguanensis]QMV00999.1 trimeric intracellular cation channel family protein [Devosia sp. D6-9]
MLFNLAFYVALMAQAGSAALSAGRRNMDLFGVCSLACVTALGGGSTRDVLLGHYPLSWVANPYLLIVVCVAALAAVMLSRFMHHLRWTFLLLDALGLVIFSTIGCDIAIAMGLHPIIVIISGMVTGILGGVLRDILCNDVPLVFTGQLYAIVSIIAGVVYFTATKLGLSYDFALVAGIVVGMGLRVAAIVYNIEIPKFSYRDQR